MPSALTSDDEIADDRDPAEHGIDAETRNQHAIQVDALAINADPAIHRQPERWPAGAAAIDHITPAANRDRRFDTREQDPFSGQRVSQSA